MRAIILAGGKGTRLRPLTNTTPKPMLPISGKPILQHHVENLVRHGITDITLSTGYLAKHIEDYFGDGNKFGANISYSHEENPLGTGGAVKQANGNNTDSFVLVWGDNVHDVNYTELLNTHNNDFTMVLTKRDDVEHFGVASLEGTRITSFVEKPKPQDAPSKWINAGVFVLNPHLLKSLPEVSSIEKELFEPYVNEKGITAYFHDGEWYPTDTKEKYTIAQQFLQ